MRQVAGRPGAMTMAMNATHVVHSGPRVLRVGLMRDGRIEMERIVREPTDVTVGRDERNTFVVPDAPGRHVLFRRDGDCYVLQVTGAMTGRAATQAGTVTFTDLARAVVLDDTARGKIDLGGGTTLLFQMVVPPPKNPKPALPSVVSGGYLSGIDWFFTSIATVSFMAFGMATLFLENADYPIEASLAEVPMWAQAYIEMPEPPPDTPEPMVDGEPTPDEPTPDTPTDATDTDSADAPERHANNDPRPSPVVDAPPSLQEIDEIRAAALMMVGSLMNTGDASAFDALRDGAPTTDAAALFAQVDAATTAVADTSVLHERRGCTGDDCEPSGDLGQLRRRPPGDAHDTIATDSITEVEVELPPGIVDLEPVDDPTGPGWFDSTAVTRQVRRRLGTIRRCYERELGRNPTIQGKVTMAFSIQPVGSVTNVRATENTTGSQSLAGCIGRTLRTIRFNPGPEGGPAHFTYPFVFHPQQ